MFRRIIEFFRRLFFGTPKPSWPVPSTPYQPPVPKPPVPLVTGTVRFGTILGGGQSVIRCETLASALAGAVTYAWYATKPDLEFRLSRISDRSEISPPIWLSPGQAYTVWLECRLEGAPEPLVMKFSYTRDIDGGWPPFGTVTYM